jgi:hypothetical protein
MMKDAMRDAGNGMQATGDETTELHNTEEEDEAFCFPGDNGGQQHSPTATKSDEDEEFCILGEDPGTGIVVNTFIIYRPSCIHTLIISKFLYFYPLL